MTAVKNTFGFCQLTGGLFNPAQLQPIAPLSEAAKAILFQKNPSVNRFGYVSQAAISMFLTEKLKPRFLYEIPSSDGFELV